jgi:hypothetical protein
MTALLKAGFQIPLYSSEHKGGAAFIFYAAAQRAQKFGSKKSGLRKLLLNLFRFDRLFAEPASLLR